MGVRARDSAAHWPTLLSAASPSHYCFFQRGRWGVRRAPHCRGRPMGHCVRGRSRRWARGTASAAWASWEGARAGAGAARRGREGAGRAAWAARSGGAGRGQGLTREGSPRGDPCWAEHGSSCNKQHYISTTALTTANAKTKDYWLRSTLQQLDFLLWQCINLYYYKAYYASILQLLHLNG